MDERTEKDAQMGKHEFPEKSKRAKEKGDTFDDGDTFDAETKQIVNSLSKKSLD